ncbi:MAG TPA: epoxyqueuosine reductase QueH [Deltaproteobacteria bacterium]|nr:epoxyqueuosine reductase QueH [Deltaproteobacteria bacterium]HQB38118.1 epoxyqueuosine reductase QueH [Deltaproteobacteria bacterium]
MKILLHTCCAPCSIYPLEQMRSSGHEVTGYFYNHNIHPYLEYQKRKETLRQFSEQVTLPMLYRDDYDLEGFLAAVADNPTQRCSYCYASRLNATAAVAAESGFKAFSTSLLYSRYQRHDEIRELGDQLARQYGIEFYYEDFRKGWQEGIRISKEMGLYRQQYCGCIYSEKDRYHRKAKS